MAAMTERLHLHCSNSSINVSTSDPQVRRWLKRESTRCPKSCSKSQKTRPSQLCIDLPLTQSSSGPSGPPNQCCELRSRHFGPMSTAANPQFQGRYDRTSSAAVPAAQPTPPPLCRHVGGYLRADCRLLLRACWWLLAGRFGSQASCLAVSRGTCAAEKRQKQ